MLIDCDAIEPVVLKLEGDHRLGDFQVRLVDLNYALDIIVVRDFKSVRHRELVNNDRVFSPFSQVRFLILDKDRKGKKSRHVAFQRRLIQCPTLS